MNNMDNAIIYRPYKTQTWVLVFMIPFGILAFMGVGYGLSSGAVVPCIFLTAMGVGCMWAIKKLYDDSKRVVVLHEKGLQMIDSYLDDRHISWEELPYAYDANNYKGFLFLVLSPNKLSHKEGKRFANRGANSSRMYIDGIVVIYMDHLQDTSRIREMVKNHVAHMDEYGS